MSAGAVTNFNNSGLEASSDSDDEDKLHIVEEDGLQEPGAERGKKMGRKGRKRTATTVLPQNGDCNGVKDVASEEEEGEEEEEDEEAEEEEGEEDEASGEKDALVEEMLQQGDTAIIYPEAPEEEEQTTAGADENGTPEHPLHICPYCSRGYKRNASLKEHIKYRHETSDDNYSCSHCSYTFTYRSQLERHMTHHRGAKDDSHKSQRHSQSGGSGGSRRFKCTTCSKAFKYKHHLKEHLRIHSGEKPYECANCMKRFSHSGSYSSHISSKKCVAAHFPNGLNYPPIKPVPNQSKTNPVAIAPAKSNPKDKMDSKPLQEQLPVTQIKTEPEEEDIKPVIVPPVTANGVNGASTVGGATLPPGVAMVVPTLGLVSPITLNMNDLQNVLKVAMDSNILKQILGTANGVQGKQGIVVQQPQRQILSLPAFVDHDGTTKIIINYSVSPAAATTANTHPANLVVQNGPPLAAPTVPIVAAAPVASKTDQTCTNNAEQETEVATDLSIVKEEPDAVPISTEEEEATKSQAKNSEAVLPQMPKSSSCLLCDECPEHLEALHLLQHRKAANGEAVDSAALDPSFADLLSEAGVTLDEPSPAEDVLSVLKTSFAANACPSDSELEKISENVSIPVDVIRKWFAKMNNKKIKLVVEKSEPPEDIPIQAKTKEVVEETQENPVNSQSTSAPSLSPNKDLVIVKSEPDENPSPLKREPEDPEEAPLDLSLPKSETSESPLENTTPPAVEQPRPLNLACINKDLLKGRALYVTTSQSGNPVNIVTATQIPTLVAIAGQGGLASLSTINTASKNRTIIIPQLAYTYAGDAGKITGAKTVVINGHKEKEKSSPTPETAPPAGEKDTELDAKRKKLDLSGVYPCDLCSKVFQKGSSLLRHKYEHTGKRPHECIICKKAFKHKHHLIEHARLHTGIKPYQCDKCGKRFSHSGSYSQHMNHRYSYCRRMTVPSSSSSSSSSTPPENTTAETPPDNDHTDSGPESPATTQQADGHTASDKDSAEEEEEEDEEEDEEGAEEAMTVEDIRVVQVDDMELGGQEEAGQEDGDKMEVQKGSTYQKMMELEFSDCEEVVVGSEEDSQEKMEEDEEEGNKDCDKNEIREGSGDGGDEPTTENAE